MTWHHYILLFAQGFLITVLLTPLMRRFAPVLGFLDQPGARKVHIQPKPLLGGAAIFLGFLALIVGNLLFLYWIYNLDLQSESWMIRQLNLLAESAKGVDQALTELIGFLAGGALLFLVGLIDDRFGMSPWIKLCGQVVAATLLYAADIRISLFITHPVVNYCLTLFWLVLITNSFNLLDNMDGLSGGVAMICLLLLGISTHLVEKQVFMTSVSFALAGCIAGFLRYNLHPSSIFMGDAGSLFIGYSVAALTIQGTFYQSDASTATAWAVVMPFVILAVPIFDTLSVILIRIKNGQPIYVGDKNHFSHRLVALGMSHRRAVFFIHLITLCEGSAALILALISEPFGAYVVLTQIVLFFIIIAMLEHIRNHFNNHHSKS
ncbi:MAG: undecaprenyl/decaprenyl-phosphate alpha-N-acetylglucosaminyl 1-phosphate transferase [Candidatus Omnitrophica bacterium]|nr:undecaprenyl/decaprenyl-phosphate alpha-N-acetylglucosaminyl 1-phosphate transferase [Candidatus Omnitrophota bacterium]